MKRLTCEMCGSSDLVKQDGMFVCQFCGTKYSIEEARKMMVDVSGSTVKVDTSAELANLYQIARRAKDDNNGENAAKYYDMILVKDPTSWEATFYVVYFKAMECKIAQIRSAGNSVANCVDTVLKLIQEHVSSPSEREKAYSEVAMRVLDVATMLFNGAKNHYDNIDGQIRSRYLQEWVNNAIAAMNCAYLLGNNMDVLFPDDPKAKKLAVRAWKQGVAWHQFLMGNLANKEANRSIINDYITKIKKYEPSYSAPEENTGGCYVATAVYGSYDCPQVWVLRRYRDAVLAKTWYGRAFIHTYYAISPTLVKWFGQTEWFKKMWKGKLDYMVANLKDQGVKDTPYADRIW